MWGLKGSQDEQKYHLENKFSVHPPIFLPSFFFSFLFFVWKKIKGIEGKRQKKKPGFSVKFPRSKSSNFWGGVGSYFTHPWASGARERITTHTGRVSVRYRVRVCGNKMAVLLLQPCLCLLEGRRARKWLSDSSILQIKKILRMEKKCKNYGSLENSNIFIIV